MPFPEAGDDKVAAYLDGFLSWCLTHTDEALGSSSDGNRLVQRFMWFLLAEPSRPVPGYSDNPAFDLGQSALLDADGDVTHLGRALISTADRIAPR